MPGGGSSERTLGRRSGRGQERALHAASDAETIIRLRVRILERSLIQGCFTINRPVMATLSKPDKTRASFLGNPRSSRAGLAQEELTGLAGKIWELPSCSQLPFSAVLQHSTVKNKAPAVSRAQVPITSVTGVFGHWGQWNASALQRCSLPRCRKAPTRFACSLLEQRLETRLRQAPNNCK